MQAFFIAKNFFKLALDFPADWKPYGLPMFGLTAVEELLMSTNTNGLNTDSGFAQEWFELVDERPKRWSFNWVIHRIWHGVIELFTPSSELKIFTGRDQHGKTYYRVYEVLTHDSHRFGSEDEVRILLEQRYYR
ncbi:hypothetical protein VB780_11710 [Leptolyngbya sp. CCNP1308]|uniref:hypothetical protein n=1 Tax=Leptolyngbya sp. CCNP1308 TaxID=3110255 RepID=UPI002B21F60B|nr:hypothetical protein [Leptolyngbya sp. CCNP1308]MEA5449239.1 hypothetical protein [Leptolyngbya sp. CCNP1308]